MLGLEAVDVTATDDADGPRRVELGEASGVAAAAVINGNGGRFEPWRRRPCGEPSGVSDSKSTPLVMSRPADGALRKLADESASFRLPLVLRAEAAKSSGRLRSRRLTRGLVPCNRSLLERRADWRACVRDCSALSELPTSNCCTCGGSGVCSGLPRWAIDSKVKSEQSTMSISELLSPESDMTGYRPLTNLHNFQRHVRHCHAKAYVPTLLQHSTAHTSDPSRRSQAFWTDHRMRYRLSNSFWEMIG